MTIDMEISICRERIAARVVHRPISFLGSNRVAVVHDRGRDIVAGGLDPAVRKALTKALAYNPNLTWWIGGELVRC